jgi:dTMP kinase
MSALGKFVAFEGPDGSGKTTQAKLLVKHLTALGYQALYTREPGGSPYAEEIRQVILSDGAKDADSETMLALFAAARRDHVMRLIKPALESGTHVICDRFQGASWMYQICAQGGGELRRFYWELHHQFLPDPRTMRPHMYLCFDVPAEVSLQRVSLRGEQATHFEARGIDFMRRIRDGGLEFARMVNAPVIDGTQFVEEVQCLVHAHVLPLLKT